MPTLDAPPGGALLSGANLQGADVRAADLSGANLRGAYLGGADFSSTIYDEYTQWDETFVPSQVGAILREKSKSQKPRLSLFSWLGLRIL
ncbi:MAG: pentapeptide repeat-containing protein [Chloroflexaceae bacterium]|nr:pentapeptide repeat-containing protein [Chloroflexaceae bacterium]